MPLLGDANPLTCQSGAAVLEVLQIMHERRAFVEIKKPVFNDKRAIHYALFTVVKNAPQNLLALSEFPPSTVYFGKTLMSVT